MKYIYFLIGILLIVAAGATAMYMWQSPTQVLPSEQTFVSPDVDVTFTYPPAYNVTVRADGYKTIPIHVVTLIHASSTVPDMSDGPTAISVIEIPTIPTTTLEAWVRENSISNFNLSPDGTFTQTTVGGEPALAYRHSGLYESDAVAVQHNGKIYLFAASWLDASDMIRTDFKNLLSSVTFQE